MDAEERLIATGAFMECVFHCPACGLGGTSVVRRTAIARKTCLSCGGDVVVTVLDRFGPSGSPRSDSGA
jgi:hypothetical protein